MPPPTGGELPRAAGSLAGRGGEEGAFAAGNGGDALRPGTAAGLSLGAARALTEAGCLGPAAMALLALAMAPAELPVEFSRLRDGRAATAVVGSGGEAGGRSGGEPRRSKGVPSSGGGLASGLSAALPYVSSAVAAASSRSFSRLRFIRSCSRCSSRSRIFCRRSSWRRFRSCGDGSEWV